MRLLLDTHVLLWWLNNDDRLGTKARSTMADAQALVHVSAASIWEASIKAQMGRLDLGQYNLAEEAGADGFTELPISSAHAWRAGWLPLHHRDPFDRLLVAQSEIEQLTLVTADPALEPYGIPILSA